MNADGNSDGVDFEGVIRLKISPEAIREGTAFLRDGVAEVIRAAGEATGNVAGEATGNVVGGAIERVIGNTVGRLLGGGRSGRTCPSFATQNGDAMVGRWKDPEDTRGGVLSNSPYITMADVVQQCRCEAGTAYAPGATCEEGQGYDGEKMRCAQDPLEEGGVHTLRVDPECQQHLAADNAELGLPSACFSMLCGAGTM